MPEITKTLKALHDYVSWNEGREYKAYNDTKGLPTIGVGFNLTRGDARAIIENLGVNYDQLLLDAAMGNGNNAQKLVQLTDAQVDAILDITLNEQIQAAKSIFPDFGTYEESRQIAITDLLNMGSTKFQGFKDTISAIKAKDWAAAAQHLLWNVKNGIVSKTQYYKDVGARGRRNADAFATGNLPDKKTWKDPGENAYKPTPGGKSKDGLKEGTKETGKEGPKEGGKDSPKEVGKEAAPKEIGADKGGKEGLKETGKDGNKEGGKDTAPKEFSADKNTKEGLKESGKDSNKEGGKDSAPKEFGADKGGKESGKEGGKEHKDGKESKEGKDGKDSKDGKETKEGGKEGIKDGKEGKDGKESKEGKDNKDGKETKEGKEGKETKEGKDNKDGKETKEGKEGKETKEGKDNKEGKETKEGKDNKDGKETKEGKDNKEGKEDKDGKDDVSFPGGGFPGGFPGGGFPITPRGWDDFSI